MAIVSPTVPSSTTSISSVELHPIASNKAFYIYSGEVGVTTTETTMISVNDIGKRAILFCMEIGCASDSSTNFHLRVKSNGQVIHRNQYSYQGSVYGADTTDLKFILPANTSLEVTIELDSSANDFTISGYGYYL